MPTSHSADEGSDISSFAAWEALHPSQSLDESADRHTDMARIWADRDSSNDERSSEDEETGENNSFGFPVQQDAGRESVGQKGRVVKMEIPSSDVESEAAQDEDDAPPSSQPRPESEDESVDEEEEPAVEENNLPGFKAGEVIEISSDEEESEEESEAEEEVEIEQDNRRQAGSEQDNGSEAEQEEERREERRDDSEAESSVDDEIEGFDVKPEDKEFFKELLHAAPAEAVIELTGKSRRATSPSSSDTSFVAKRARASKISALAVDTDTPDVQMIKRVKLFAEEHLFRSKFKWTEEELEEYEDDVYVFARAAGFSNPRAGLEVGKAVGAWKTERGMTPSHQLLIEAASTKPPANAGKLPEEAKKKRKKEKKARRKQKRLERARSSRATSTANSETRHQDHQNLQSTGHPKLQNSQSYYVAEAATAPKTSTNDDKVISTADEISVGLALKSRLEKKAEKKKRRKMAKLGPKKSEYFPGAAPATASKSKDIGAPMSRQEGKRQIKEAKRLLAEKKVDDDGLDAGRIKQMAREAKQAVEKAPVLVKEIPAKKEQNVSAPANVEPELAGKGKETRKRKKKRNKNRLPEEEHVITYTSVDTNAGKADELIPKKRDRDGSPKSDLAEESGNVGRRTALNSFKKLLVENGASSSSQKAMSRSAQGPADESHRPPKRRDRGEQKSKVKNDGLELPDASEGMVAIPAIPASDSVFESTETGETSSQRKRKRRKAKAIEANESSEIGGQAKSSALVELTNSQKLHDDRAHSSEKRAMSAGAMGFDRLSSAQSSKVHHSQ